MLLAFNFYYTIEVIIILAILFILSQIFKLFDIKGAIGAVIIGAIVSFTGNLNWLILLIIFAFVSHLATKYKFEEKLKRRQQEGTRGERRISNVAYGGAIGVVIAIFNYIIPYNVPFFVMFAAAFAAITSDTLGSEIGVLYEKTYLITTLKRVETGINGGVSVQGTFAALFGSLTIALSYVILSGAVNWVEPFAIILVAGFLGSNVDSLLGALFENKGEMTKGQVNLASSVVAVLFTLPFLL